MNPLDLQSTILRVVDLIGQRDRRQAAARGLNPPPGIRPMAARPQYQPPPGSAPAPNPASEAFAIARTQDQGPTPLAAPAVGALPNAGVGSAPATATPDAAPLGGWLAGTPTLDFMEPLAGVGQALDAGRGEVAAEQGNDMYRWLYDGSIPGWQRAVAANIPFKRKLFDWAEANPDLVKSAYEEGYLARDGQTRFTGGRAVWEAYARQNLTGNLEGALTGFAMDPLNLLGGPVRATGTGIARQAPRVAEALGGGAAAQRAGQAVRLGGQALALPDRLYTGAIDAAGNVLGGGLRAAGNAAQRTRIGAQVGRWFEASPWAVARRNLNETLAARTARNAATARGARRVVDPLGTSPPEIVTPPAAAPEPAAVSAYEEAFSGGARGTSNRVQAAARARNRLTALRDALPEGEWRGRIDAIWSDLEHLRNDILATTEAVRGPGSDIRNAANRAELWLAEFEAERAARGVLAEAGVAAPPYRNTQPTGSLAANLDALAWNPDEVAAGAAREVVLAAERRAEEALGADSTVTANLRAAREAAEGWRARGTGVAAQEPSAAVARQEPVEAHLEGMADPDRAAWRAALGSENGRSAEFGATDTRLRAAHDAVATAFDAVGEGADDAYQLAATAYEEAWQEASRLLERVKREDDAFEAAFAAGATTVPPDVADAIRGGGEDSRAAAEAADESFALGPIVAQESEDALARVFGERSSQYRGRGYGEVADELEAQVAADKNRLLQLLSRPEPQLAPKEKTELNRLLKTYPGVATLSDAAAIDVGDTFRRRLLDAFEEEAGAGKTRLGGALDTGSRVYSAVNLLMPWAFPRYYLANAMGDSWQVLMAHGPQAAAAANNPENLAALTRYARNGGDPLVGAVGDAVKGWGLGGFHPALVTENLAEAIWARERTAVNRAGGRARFNLIGGVDRVTGAVTDPARNVANGLEWAHRTGLWAHLMDIEAIGRKATFAAEMAGQTSARGLFEADLRAILEAHPRIDGAEVADAVGRLALARGVAGDEAKGIATEVGRRWASEVYKADEAARAGVNRALFSYEQKNIDLFTRRVIPFHMWMSRAIPFYAEQALRHPGFAAAYYRLWEATNEAAEQENWPDTLKTFHHLWTGPGGLMLMFNPLAAVGLLDFAFETNGGYTDENTSAVGGFLARAGEYGATLLPWWAGMLNYAGYLGDSPIGLDPIGTHQARRFIGTHLQTLAAQGLIGDPTYLGKPFEEAAQRLRAATSGFLPGSIDIPAGDPNAVPMRDIRNGMLREELRERGLTLNQYLALAAEAETDATSEAGLLVAEINDAVAAEELDGGARWQAALREWARGTSAIALIGAVLPGPKRTRQGEGLAIQALAGGLYEHLAGEDTVVPGVGPAGAGHDPGALLDGRDEDFVRAWEERFGGQYRPGDLRRMLEAAARLNEGQNAAPESAAVLEQQAAYHALGTERERDLLAGYYDIAFARGDLSMPGQKTSRLARGRGGRMWMSQEELARLDQDTRWDLAEAWLREADRRGELGRLRELQGLYEETHPEFGAYQAWQRGVRDEWGTASAFRAAATRANPNFARYVQTETARLRGQGLPVSEIATKLDDAALSLDGYLAYTGRRKSRFDPNPLETGQAIPTATEGGLGGGGYGGAANSRTWGERVYDALEATQAALAASERYLGVPLDSLPPEFQAGYVNSADFPEEAKPPSDYWIYEDYLSFAAEAQASGEDPSVEAFVVATSEDPAEAPPQFEGGVWPPEPSSPRNRDRPRRRLARAT